MEKSPVRKCEPISTAAAYRTDVATVVSQMEQDAKLWTQHYSTPGQAPLWQQIAMNLSQAGVVRDSSAYNGYLLPPQLPSNHAEANER